MNRPTWAEVDLRAVRANVDALTATVAPAALMAVVKADAYGHGAVEVARTVIEAGASALAVALVEEAAELRAGGITAPILLLSDVSPSSLDEARRLDLDVTVSTRDSVDSAREADLPRLHLKVDTGMHRIGCRPDEAAELGSRAGESLHGVWTHLADADTPNTDVTDHQLARFATTLDALGAMGIRWSVTHAANSAAAIAYPAARFNAVRCGIALYGVAPSPTLSDRVALVPALSLHSRVSALRTVESGEAVSYGGHWRADRPTRLATVPIGYADGVPRRLGLTGGAVLVRGRRRPIRGVVTMDQLMVEVDRDVAIDDHVVLLGSQGGDSIDAWDWARRIDTIAYEIVTGIGPRVPRHYLR